MLADKSLPLNMLELLPLKCHNSEMTCAITLQQWECILDEALGVKVSEKERRCHVAKGVCQALQENDLDMANINEPCATALKQALRIDASGSVNEE